MTLATASDPVGSGALTESTTDGSHAFEVRLDNFEGPFDLLLSLISKHKLDITEVSLHQVTDEFIAHVKAGASSHGDGNWDLEQTSSFLVVASTLLDLKSARLLPQGEIEDEEDLALLEARDLLFARLLQYRAFKQVAAVVERRLAEESRRHPRAVGLEERYAGLLPEVLIGIGLDAFAALAAKALEPRPELEVSLEHIHAPAVSVREQAEVVAERLRRTGTMTFRALCGDSPDMITTVARFLALLELFRENAVAFDQISPLGELTVRWTGGDDPDSVADLRIDEFEGAPEPEPSAETPQPSPVEPVEAPRRSSVERVETPRPSSVEPVETPRPASVEPVETPRPSSVEPVETTSHQEETE
jgi:segregation and condensation protein A